jgi:hypothetical protein
MMYGVLDREQYEKWDKTDCPKDGYSGDVWGGSVIMADAEKNMFPPGYTHVRIQWKEKVRDCVPTFLAWIAYVKLKYGKGCRLVFGFDS